MTEANHALLREINEKQDTRTGMLQELLGIAKRGGGFQRAEAEGISEAAVRAIVVRLGGEGIGRDDPLSCLDNWIDSTRRDLTRHTDESEAFKAARRKAWAWFNAGRIDEELSHELFWNADDASIPSP